MPFKFKKFVFLSLSLCLVSCAGSQHGNSRLEYYGLVEIEPSKEYGADYRVMFNNGSDFGYDGEDRQDRIKVLNSYAANTCPSGHEILKEESINMGKYLFGGPKKKYFIYIKCK